MKKFDKSRIWGWFDFSLTSLKKFKTKKAKVCLFSQKRHKFTSQKKNMRLIWGEIKYLRLKWGQYLVTFIPKNQV